MLKFLYAKPLVTAVGALTRCVPQDVILAVFPQICSARRWAVAAWTQAQVPLGGEALARRIIVWRRIDAGAGDAELADVEALAAGLLGAK